MTQHAQGHARTEQKMLHLDHTAPWRRRALMAVLASAACLLMWRSVDLQVVRNDFLQREGRARHVRTLTIAAHRGNLLDRQGQPLAVSTPVDSIWLNPKEVDVNSVEFKSVVSVLGLDAKRSARNVAARSEREFMYLRRHVQPHVARKVRAFAAPGVYLQREYRRYYPSAELSSHVIGFTNIDDHGQEGLELAYEDALSGRDGRETVVKDRKGAVVETVRTEREMRPGRDITLSLDRRVQYFVYRALARGMKKHRARAASAVVLDVHTGEVLAMVNLPAYNPNKRAARVSGRFRNRVVTDQFEPGSTIKPFTLAAALSSGRFTLKSRIDTSPGVLQVAGHTVRDVRDLGVIDLVTLIKKSSNVGMTKIAMKLEPEALWETLHGVGFGSVVGSDFPGEAQGVLPHHLDWREINQATLSFGYGMSVTALQLARAYAAIANGGTLPAVTLVKRATRALGERVLEAHIAAKVRHMLEAVVSEEGTGTRARVHGYRVGGKTGTVRKPIPGGYADDRHLALFAGIAPMSRPRLAVVIVVDEPRGKRYYGGEVAAPIFAEALAGSLRVLGVAPDDTSIERAQANRLARANVSEVRR